jgi:hypothetical protein
VERRTLLVKVLSLLITVLFMVVAGREFRAHRTFREPVVAGEGVTAVRTLGDYHPGVKGTVNDCNIYFLDSGKPGATVLVFGGTHPEEPAANLTAELFVENARVEQGRLLVVIRGNRSASTYTRNGEAYPTFYRIPTSWGEKTYRMGDRCSSPLDSWPDPEVYLHYPTKQMLAYMDIRNLNRAWPGRPDGLLTERTTFAFMELIRREKVDVFIDLHEAELEYPVENTIVAHEKAHGVAAMTSMVLTAQEFPVPIGMEFSPVALRGLSHREVGDNSDAMSMIFEVAEPFLDRIRGITDETLLLEGKDEFVKKAGEHGLLYAPMDDSGWPIAVRVGRHASTVLQTLETFNTMETPERQILVSGVPRYAELVDKGLGAFFRDPSGVPQDRVFYE